MLLMANGCSLVLVLATRPKPLLLIVLSTIELLHDGWSCSHKAPQIQATSKDNETNVDTSSSVESSRRWSIRDLSRLGIVNQDKRISNRWNWSYGRCWLGFRIKDSPLPNVVLLKSSMPVKCHFGRPKSFSFLGRFTKMCSTKFPLFTVKASPKNVCHQIQWLHFLNRNKPDSNLGTLADTSKF